MTAQSIDYLKRLALVAPSLPREVPSYSPQARFYELARRQVPVLVDEVERLRADVEALKAPASAAPEAR